MSTAGNPKKRPRSGSSTRLSSLLSDPNSKPPSKSDDASLPENKFRQLLQAESGGFNDALTADVILHLLPENPNFDVDNENSEFVDDQQGLELYLHSSFMHRSKYFSALLSDRWRESSSVKSGRFLKLTRRIPLKSLEDYVMVLRLMYLSDFYGVIRDASIALSLLPIALEFLFDDCVRACVKFLEAVPWTEEEEARVLSLAPLLRHEESVELLTRVSPEKVDASEEMLHGLILAAIHSHPNVATVKAFVAKLLRDHSSRESVRRVLDCAFDTSLKTVKESLEEYSSPNLRGDHEEIEALQRLNLHSAVVNGRHLLWLVERMTEFRVADSAVKEWSNLSNFAADLQRAFTDDAWRNIAPGLPALILRCTWRLGNAVAAGSILVDRQVRMKLVKDWLPVLIVCKDNATPIPSGQKSLYLELEETFLRIISTLPMSHAQELLQQCLTFSTRNVEECPHLVSAFDTWFRRAARAPPSDAGV
ncbi:BTB/POZ domain-containing protein At1g63850 isoform X1 [Amborella trichopoda]|uniref:BTB/POZ domain-containing protein At1g63850 isoform X1 n=1 Tax=Amborella trichopoda TaxID=13333 RepID=UPI0005D37F03|nr:BTB/POZ domain-containing protein At1g63850 isoform X1 [Amborella trichopoda]|eukprot:XP_006856016.2 BTB/POZ domain-containing protein At1g63850 isoform X1 [Amborella trichopoda]